MRKRIALCFCPVMLTNKKIMNRFLYYEAEGLLDGSKNFERFFCLISYCNRKYKEFEIVESVFSEN